MNVYYVIDVVKIQIQNANNLFVRGGVGFLLHASLSWRSRGSVKWLEPVHIRHHVRFLTCHWGIDFTSSSLWAWFHTRPQIDESCALICQQKPRLLFSIGARLRLIRWVLVKSGWRAKCLQEWKFFFPFLMNSMIDCSGTFIQDLVHCKFQFSLAL